MQLPATYMPITWEVKAGLCLSSSRRKAKSQLPVSSLLERSPREQALEVPLKRHSPSTCPENIHLSPTPQGTLG